MKTKWFVFLLGFLLVAGCATNRPTLAEVQARVAKADRDWAEFNNNQTPKAFAAGRVGLERRMYEKVLRSDVPEWRKRRAGWNYIIAVNEARIPEIRQPPGRYTVQPNPFY